MKLQILKETNFEMKEVKYYISDDESKQSPNPEEIKEYEAKISTAERC